MFNIFVDTFLYSLSNETINTRASRDMSSQKIVNIGRFTYKTIPKLTYGSHTARHTHNLYQCAKYGDDRTSFSVIFDVCDV